MNNEQKFSLKRLLNDSNFIRDTKTVIAFLFAYGIAVVSNGLIEGFSPQALISIAVSLGAIGTFFAVKIITNEFSERGMFDEEESNKELQERLSRQKELSAKINYTEGYEILQQYNKDKFEYLRKAKYNDLKQKYELEIKRFETMIENTRITRKLKWFTFANQWVLGKLKRKLKKMKYKLSKLSPNDIYIKYRPVELEQLQLSDFDEKDAKFNEAERFSITPQKRTRKRLAATNFIKTFFFVGFQGAAIAQISSYREFFIFLALMTLTLATTAVTAYVNTRRYAALNFITIIDEKVEKLKWIISETDKRLAEKEKAVAIEKAELKAPRLDNINLLEGQKSLF